MGRLKIVYPVCCGMDVHRDFLIACIAATNAQGVTEYQSRRFSTYTGSLRELRDWLLANDCKDVVWNQQVNIGSQFTTFWRSPAMW